MASTPWQIRNRWPTSIAVPTFLAVASDATEGFGLPVLEAMACGLPVVVTDIPAFRGFAEPQDFARFVAVGDPVALARALVEVLDDPLERQRLSRRSLEVAGAYTMQRSFQAMSEALERIITEVVPAF